MDISDLPVFTPQALPGDFNYDGAIDAADYVVWRKGLSTTYAQNDYMVWRANFGRTAGNGDILDSSSSSAVPASLRTSYC